MAGTTPLGTTVLVGTTTLTDVLDVNYSPGSTELIDITDLSDTTRVKLAGYVDTGSISVTINWTSADYSALETIASAGVAVTGKVTFSDGSTWLGTDAAIIDMAGFAISGGSGVTSSFSIHQLSAWTFSSPA
jgi:hypothetical protein